MSSTSSWTQYRNPLGLSSFTRRLDIVRRHYLNNRFDRKSPIPALPSKILDRIYGYELTFPPRRFLMQPGTQTIDGLFFLVSLAVLAKARSIFEIGTFTGLTTWTLARNLPEADVHTLDIPSGSAAQWNLDVDDVHRSDENALIYSFLPGGEGITQHWEDSATFDFSPWRQMVDLIYIDGAHSDAYVRSDTSNGLSMLSPNGAIVWDDYWRLSPGVSTVLHEQSQRLKLYRVPGTRLVVHFSSRLAAELLGPDT